MISGSNSIWTLPPIAHGLRATGKQLASGSSAIHTKKWVRGQRAETTPAGHDGALLMRVVERGQFRLSARASFAAVIPQHGRKRPFPVWHIKEAMEGSPRPRKRNEFGISGKSFLGTNSGDCNQEHRQHGIGFHTSDRRTGQKTVCRGVLSVIAILRQLASN
jgi:hypothetical protein